MDPPHLRYATPPLDQDVLYDDGETVVLLPLQTGTSAVKSRTFVLSDENRLVFHELKDLIFQGDWETLLAKLLEYKDFPIDSQDNSDGKFSLLHHSVSKGKVDCIRVLIEFSANTNIKAENGWTPIHLLVNSGYRDAIPLSMRICCNHIVKCLNMLIDGGGDVDLEDDRGETPLYYAARNCMEEPAKLLLRSGADINHWVDGTSVATILAQYLPDVLKTEFDKRITIDRKEGRRGLRLDFRLLLQHTAIHEGFARKMSSAASRFLSVGRTKGSQRQRKVRKAAGESTTRRNSDDSGESSSSSILHSIYSPKETELLNYLLKADLVAIEAVVNHPLVEAFVYLKWLSVRKLFFALRSLYLFLIFLYTFYVFHTFVSDTCFYTRIGGGDSNQNDTSLTGMMEETTEKKATFGGFIPIGSGKKPWQTFSEYFKAHVMTCEPDLKTQVLACIFAVYAITGVLYELYKMCESWYDYFQVPLNFAWWIFILNIGISVVPGLGLWAHSWHYPHAALSLVYGWILVLAQIERIPYFGIFVGIFVKVLQDFCVLLFTFASVLIAFALGFAVILPQNEFFRSIPLSVFKVFLMMTGDVDFWGIFRESWAVASINEHYGYVYIPLFIIYTTFILMVTMVLMSLLIGLAVNDIQEIRRKASLERTVRLIQEIGLFESILQMPVLVLCGCSTFLTRFFSITSLQTMNGPELITFPKEPEDHTLPPEIKQKLVPYLRSCCGSGSCHDQNEEKKALKVEKGKGSFPTKKTLRTRPSTLGKVEFLKDSESKTQAGKGKSGGLNRESSVVSTAQAVADPQDELSREVVHRDLVLYHEVTRLLDDNEKLRKALETLKCKLISRK